MKHVKKIMALVIAMVMTIAMSISAFAEANKTITVKNANAGQSYTLYKIFDATVNSNREEEMDVDEESEVTTSGINYTLPSGKSLDTEYTYTDSSNETHKVKGADWFSVDAAGNITAKSGADVTSEAFREWAKQFGTNIETKENETDEKADLVFEELEDGYYFMTTTTGSLVTVTSVAPNAIVKDKNGVPTVTKTEDQSTNDFGDIVTYTVEVNLVPGTKNVVFYDELSAGLTLQGEGPTSVKVGTSDLATSNYTVNKWEEVTDSGSADIRIEFTQAYLDSIREATTVKITYNAQINENAAVNECNDAYLQYGENNDIESEHVTVYESTFKFKVNKVDGSNEDAALDGAKFVLSTSGSMGDLTETLTGTQKAGLLKFDSDGKQTTTGDNYILEANNSVTFNGLDGDADGTTYYLYEVKAPDGYNKLTAPVELKITPTFDTTDVTKVNSYKVSYKLPGAADFVECVETDINVDHEFKVQNNQGTLLPSTGGMGTRLFYLVGGILVVIAGVLLVSRKRMERED